MDDKQTLLAMAYRQCCQLNAIINRSGAHSEIVRNWMTLPFLIRHLAECERVNTEQVEAEVADHINAGRMLM